MNASRQLIATAIAALLAAVPCLTHAQEKYPVKPIRILVTFSAGSQVDILARLFGPRMFEGSGHQVLVDNRPSGGGAVASQFVANANPDGYTLLMVSAGHAASASLYSKLPYDVIRDFAGVSQISSSPSVLIVGKDSGIKSMKDLIALARSRPGQINFASAGMGSASHIVGEMFKYESAIDIIHVPYKGAPEVLNDLLASRVHLYFSSLAAAIPFIRDGRMLALTVSTKERTPALPNVPTMAEAGLPGFEFDQWFAMLAPVKTPRPIVNQLSKEIARVLSLPEVRERMLSLSASPKPSTPEELDAFITSEAEKLGKIVRLSGARIN